MICMKNRKFNLNFIFAQILVGFLFAVSAGAQVLPSKNTRILKLGETEIRINIYEKKGAPITFFAPHYNEQIGRTLAREIIGKRGGRLIEIESLDEKGNPARQLRFIFQGRNYSVDPNRIYTENGLRCSGFSPEVSAAIKSFTAELLKIILAPGGGKLRDGEKFLVAVHNNSDVNRLKDAGARARDLTAYAFSRYARAFGSGGNNFHEQADGVYLSNVEADEDNFFFISTPAFLGFFAEKGFNAVLQKPAAKLKSSNCGIDDGSLSVFAGLRNLPYINVEADAVSGAARQLQMLEALYELWQKLSENESQSVLVSDKSKRFGAIKQR
jgi:hypothetical protein